jgi:hypothetical protein
MEPAMTSRITGVLAAIVVVACFLGSLYFVIAP